jgi:hypothetical protein
VEIEPLKRLPTVHSFATFILKDFVVQLNFVQIVLSFENCCLIVIEFFFFFFFEIGLTPWWSLSFFVAAQLTHGFDAAS